MNTILKILLFIYILPGLRISSAHDQNITYTKIFISEKKIKVDFITHINLLSGVFPEILTNPDSLIPSYFIPYFNKGFIFKNNTIKCAPHLISTIPLPDINSYEFIFEFDCNSAIDLFSLDYDMFFQVSETHENIVDIILLDQTQQIVFSSDYKHIEFSVTDLLLSWGKKPFVQKEISRKVTHPVIIKNKIKSDSVLVSSTVIQKKDTLIRNVSSPAKIILFEKQNSLDRTYLFFKMGIKHILTGYDHILFLLGLLLIATGLGNIFKIITSFTIAHSITLLLATLQIINLSSKITESIIALSILYIAIENVIILSSHSGNSGLFGNPTKRWIITFLFGLIHGLGFSSVLLDLHLPQREILPSLLFFNLGVETGQLSMVALLFPLLFYSKKRKWHIKMVRGVSIVIGIIGIIWFFERIFLF